MSKIVTMKANPRMGTLKKNGIILVCCLVLLFQFFQILFFNRSTFMHPYDVSYWKDRFEHSQWQLPLSDRSIGDDGLYAYVGYLLVGGLDPSVINAEMPPVGKYLIGLSIVVFHNPAYYAFILGSASLVVFYFLAKRFLSPTFALITVLFLYLDTLFFNQLWSSWVDITQLFFLLVHFLILSSLQKKNRRGNYLLSVGLGVSLGLFAESKLPIFLPILFLIETYYFLFVKREIKRFFLYVVALICTVLLVYMKYFLAGHTLLDFIKLEKYIVAFYLKSHLHTHIGVIWQILFLGKFTNLVSNAKEPVVEWTILWPFITMLACISGIKMLISKKVAMLGKQIVLFLISLLVLYSFIPSYTRYLLLALPFFYLLSVWFVANFSNKLFQILFFSFGIVFGIVHAYLFLIPKPNSVLSDFYYNLSHHYFQDIYEEDLAATNALHLSQTSFRIIAQQAWIEGEIENISIKEIKRDMQKKRVTIRMTYTTRDLGTFSEEKKLALVQESSQWKIAWSWDIIFNTFQPKDSITTDITLGKRGAILTANGKVAAEDTMGSLIFVNPAQIDSKKETAMLSAISKYVYQQPIRIQNAYLEDVLPNTSVAVGTTFIPLSQKDKQALLSYPGVSLQQYPVREYNALDPTSIQNILYPETMTRIYSSTSYHGVFGPEKQFDTALAGQNGGLLAIVSSSGEVLRTMIERSSRNGRDIVLPL